MKRKSELPEQPDPIAVGEAGGQARYYQHKFPLRVRVRVRVREGEG